MHFIVLALEQLSGDRIEFKIFLIGDLAPAKPLG
jgi:hypothetical protein